jgi:hypothetical protein
MYNISPTWVRQLTPYVFAYRLSGIDRADVLIAELPMFEEALTEVCTILCAGPNPIFFHTDYTASPAAARSSGDVAPGHFQSVSIDTVKAGLKAQVYLLPKYGLTIVGIYCGAVDQHASLENPAEAIKELQDLFL